jgi:phosphohistidine phosphatase
MNLYLLRHGLAVEPGGPGFTDDSERALTPKGKAKLEKVAAAMKALDLSFDLILSSPYVRAKQTAELVAEGLKARRRLEFTETLTPSGNAKKLVELINHLIPKDVLLVGHEPFLSEFISLLVAGTHGVPIVMKKAGLCKLSMDSLRYGRCATLEWLLTPKQMLLMA